MAKRKNDYLFIIGNKTRREILKSCENEPLSATKLKKKLKLKSFGLLYQHLRILRNAGLISIIKAQKDGKFLRGKEIAIKTNGQPLKDMRDKDLDLINKEYKFCMEQNPITQKLLKYIIDANLEKKLPSFFDVLEEFSSTKDIIELPAILDYLQKKSYIGWHITDEGSEFFRRLREIQKTKKT